MSSCWKQPPPSQPLCILDFQKTGQWNTQIFICFSALCLVTVILVSLVFPEAYSFKTWFPAYGAIGEWQNQEEIGSSGRKSIGREEVRTLWGRGCPGSRAKDSAPLLSVDVAAALRCVALLHNIVRYHVLSSHSPQKGSQSAIVLSPRNNPLYTEYFATRTSICCGSQTVHLFNCSTHLSALIREVSVYSRQWLTQRLTKDRSAENQRLQNTQP